MPVIPIGSLTALGVKLRLDSTQDYTFYAGSDPVFVVLKDGTVEPAAMSTPEGKVKKRVRDMFEAFAPNVTYTMPLTGGFGNSGTPDFLACCWGHFLAVECKAGNNTTTALQDREIEKIRTAGGKALVINEHNLEELAITLGAWKEHHDRDSNER